MSQHINEILGAMKAIKDEKVRAAIGAYYRRGIGAANPGSAAPKGGDPTQPGCALPRYPTGLDKRVPVTGPCPPQFKCDCDLIGATTLVSNPTGVTGAVTLTVTDFDAAALQATAIWFTAFTAGATAGTIATPVAEQPVLLTDVFVGRSAQLRTGGIDNGLNSAAFAATREPVCVDWDPFRSQNGQELTLQFQNILDGAPAIHIFVVLWCNVLGGC